jgi:hypothetical protein
LHQFQGALQHLGVRTPVPFLKVGPTQLRIGHGILRVQGNGARILLPGLRMPL